MSWQDWTQLVGTIVSSVAAVGALFFAWLTVRQTRDLRREDWLARLGDLVGGYSATLLRIINGEWKEKVTSLPVGRARLEAALAAASEPVPACHALLDIDVGDARAADNVVAATKAAADELSRLST
jgi:hypothetical protein